MGGCAWALALVWAFATAAQAQSDAAARAGSLHGAATRSVSTYLAKERTLQDALAGRDADAARGLLNAGFEAYGPAGAAPIDSEQWLRRELMPATPARPVRDLAVREFDDIAVVHFVLGGPAIGARAGGGPVFAVVDVWRQSTGKLLMRVIERPAHPAPVPTRPSGRE